MRRRTERRNADDVFVCLATQLDPRSSFFSGSHHTAYATVHSGCGMRDKYATYALCAALQAVHPFSLSLCKRV